MIDRTVRLLALAPAFLPVAARAHGDHTGIRGVVHVLTTADHLGLAFMALLLSGTVVHWLRGFRVRRDRSGTDST